MGKHWISPIPDETSSAFSFKRICEVARNVFQNILGPFLKYMKRDPLWQTQRDESGDPTGAGIGDGGKRSYIKLITVEDLPTSIFLLKHEIRNYLQRYYYTNRFTVIIFIFSVSVWEIILYKKHLLLFYFNKPHKLWKAAIFIVYPSICHSSLLNKILST